MRATTRYSGLAFLALLFVLAWPATADDETHPALWRVDSGDATLYLFGTMHMLPEGYTPLAPVIERAVDASDALVLEMNLSAMNQSEIQQLMFRRGLNTDGRRLSGIVGTERWPEVEAAVREIGLQPVLLEGMQPWLAGMTLTVAALHGQGMRPERGVESYLLARVDDAVEVRELESFREQLGVLSDLPEETQIALLMQTVREMDEIERVTQQTLAAWAEGDVAAQERYLLETYSDYPNLYRALVLDRHAQWLPQFKSMLADSGTWFVAVGALHLVGEDSIIRGLEQAGYTVQRIDGSEQ